MSEAPFLSAAHGHRWVEVYVDPPSAAELYITGAPIPEGTIVVKTSVEDDDGQPGTFPGPVFVMQKLAEDADPERGDWFYAIHWADPTPRQREVLGGPIYWRGTSPKVDYCFDACHDIYDRGLGGLTPSSLVPR
ncbi:MAG: hypothetical protein R2939_08005 [Kofleriaceae bacterium]